MQQSPDPESGSGRLDKLARTLRLLANPDRLRVLMLLSSEEHDVGSLARESKLSSSRVSQHLALLRAHDVVRDRREGRHVYYRLLRPGLARWLKDSFDQGAVEPVGGIRS